MAGMTSAGSAWCECFWLRGGRAPRYRGRGRGGGRIWMFENLRVDAARTWCALSTRCEGITSRCGCY